MKIEEPYIDGIEDLLDELHDELGFDEEWIERHDAGSISVWSRHPDEQVAFSPFMLPQTKANARMLLIAALHPKRVRLLLEKARGLADVVWEQGQEDGDEVCAVCGRATDGHTHQQCYESGKEDGFLDRDIGHAVELGEALGFDAGGMYFPNALEAARERFDKLLGNALTLCRALEKSDGCLSEPFQTALDQIQELQASIQRER